MAFGKKLDFKIVCTGEIVKDNQVRFSVNALNETDYSIKALTFPGPFNSKNSGENSYHVDAMRQGFILPDGYKENRKGTVAYSHYMRKINTGDCYLPIWGRVCDGNTFTAIIETPYDACVRSRMEKHKAFVSKPY